jgi:hypothetical protein
MNPEQLSAHNQIVQSAEQGLGKCFFLHGPGGTGKTFVYNTVCHTLRAQGKVVLCVASSGIAALLLDGGRTSHSRFKIPIQVHESSTCSIKKNSKEAELIRRAVLVNWDEAPMQHRHCFETVDRTFRDIRECDQPFGGLTMVLGGDFQQILPVIVKGSPAQIVGSCIQRSELWATFSQNILHLRTNMRLGNDQQERDFAQWLLDVGHGKHTDFDANIKLPDSFKCRENSVKALIDQVYPDVHTHHPDSWFSERTILSARNDDVDSLNEAILSAFPGDLKVYHSADSISKEGQDGAEIMYPVEYLNTIKASGLPLAKLSLKLGCPVMVLRNMDPANGVCNGTRGILTRMNTHVVEIRLLGGENAGQKIFLPKVKLSPSDALLPFPLQRIQFPLRLAFSMTINKSQGQSVKHVGLDLRSPVFTHGQFYVAVSRATSVHRIHAIWDPKSEQPWTKNIVYPQVLLD